MVKKYLIILLSVFIIAIGIQVIGVIQINNAGINHYKVLENERKSDSLNLYFSNQFDNMEILTRAHAYWTDALNNVNSENESWVNNYLSEYLTDGNYNVDFVYLTNESSTFKNAVGIDIDTISDSTIYTTVLSENEEARAIIEVDNKIYMVTGYPFATDDQQNKQGAFLIGRELNQGTLDDLKILIGQDLYDEHLNITVDKNFDPLEDYEHNIFSVESIDETLYVHIHFDYQFSNYLNKTIKGYLLVISLLVLVIFAITIFSLFDRFKKEMDKTLSQLSEIDVSNNHFRPLQPSKAPEFNNIIKVINQLGINIESNIEKLMQKNLEVVELLSTASEINDPYTSQHSNQVSVVSTLIAQKLNLPEVNKVKLCAKLHDIGKVFIQLNILNKEEKLSQKEFEAIKKHPEFGAELLTNLTQFDDIRLGVLHHHEKYDGTGYPSKLKGKDIPIYARIIAVADVFDALLSRRPYRKSFSREKALEIMAQGRDKHFDPDILDVFFELVESNQI
ncbi:MAG: HD domain-containing protein [Candidatus Izimaplasma sp.]|nr:HD domain-containing protein [Candidatus Izimaplasma bacterium]